ncbi:helix-turn-helix domain-containing protein [Sporosarcina psychrophila]|uniref:helix-turn-helix domain-containing protein n=1 Tax=Sporosarcina psychrophila TaxID=1476 RepID=UPI00078CEC73|nr:helix-turn-helix domain-containing protein [Sporosarcina psychrophila]AMQ07426.1 hypothetical protein AZE41_16605 [Sporosarcina psychrophila]
MMIANESALHNKKELRSLSNKGCIGGKKKYHTAATGKDKVIYERVVQLLSENKNIVDIHREVGISRNTIYTIKADL